MIPAARLIRTLNPLIDWYQPPLSIRMDNGTEINSHDITEWAAAKGLHIDLGDPNRSAYIQRVSRAHRHDVLDAYVKALEHVQQITENWLRIYEE